MWQMPSPKKSGSFPSQAGIMEPIMEPPTVSDEYQAATTESGDLMDGHLVPNCFGGKSLYEESANSTRGPDVED